MFQTLMESERKHTSIITRDITSSLSILIRYKLQFLKLTESNGTKLSTLVKALNCFPTLKIFEANEIYFVDDFSKSTNCMKTVNTELEQLKCVVEIIHIFTCCTVEKLKLSSNNPIDENRQTLVIDFLNRQKNLKELNLHEETLSILFTQPEFLLLKCPLKIFKHHIYPESIFSHYESLIKFLNQHKTTLTSLKLNFYTEPHFGLGLIHKFALENIINLKHISMIYYRISFPGLMFFEELPAHSKITNNLESLKLATLSINQNLNKSFIDMLHNIKYLKLKNIEETDKKLLHYISEKCINLESLKIFSICNKFSVIYFPNLKELSIEICSEDVEIFIKRHSQTLERIIIQDLDEYFSRFLVKEILNCPNLNYLELNFDQMYLPSLRLISEISLKTKPFTLKIKNIIPNEKQIFHFPDDGAVWDDFHVTKY